MSIFLLLVYALTCYGISNMIIYSNGPGDIFLKFRKLTNDIHPKLGELFSCMMCLPFWIGVIISAMDLFLLTGIAFAPYNLIPYDVMLTSLSDKAIYYTFVVTFDGFVSSATTWVIHNIEEFFEK